MLNLGRAKKMTVSRKRECGQKPISDVGKQRSLKKGKRRTHGRGTRPEASNQEFQVSLGRRTPGRAEKSIILLATTGPKIAEFRAHIGCWACAGYVRQI